MKELLMKGRFMKKLLSFILAFFIAFSVFSYISEENLQENEILTQDHTNSQALNSSTTQASNDDFMASSKMLTYLNVNENSLNQAINSNQDQMPITRVFATISSLTALLELLYPQGMIGRNYKPYPEDIPFMPQGVASLPVLGARTRINYEALLALKPELIIFDKLSFKDFSKPYEALGIKILQADHDFSSLDATIKAYGEALGVQERANRLLSFYNKTQSLLDDLRDKITKKPRIYFAFGVEGLHSVCVKKGQDDDLATAIGGENVIKCEQITTSVNLLPMSFETLIALNPEAIFVREIGLYKDLKEGKLEQWQRLEAIKNGRFYYAPSSPSNWLNRPPTVMRILGFPWAFSKLHSELLSENEVRTLAKEFFAEFLRPISDEDYDKLEGK
ncbi:hypothetical protein DMC01_04430 [Campylobacter troglodytis]|nr:hypothetical protein DMC01_04430 [Campylobacter troglodytis]